MEAPIQPVTLIGAGLVAQLSLLFILLVGGLTIRRSERAGNLWRVPTYSNIAWLVLVLAVLSLGALILTDALEEVWGPAFHGYLSGILPWSTALTLTFSLDLLWLAIVINMSGGSQSPFQPLLFIIPPLAIFLGQPISNVIWYAVIAAALFSAFLFLSETKNPIAGRRRLALWLVSVLGLSVTVAVGVITRY